MKKLAQGFRWVAASGMLWSAAALAQPAALQLVCPAGAQAGDPATPLNLTTGPGWQIRYGAGGTWGPAYTAYRHPAWYNPAAGTWLTPGDPATVPAIASAQPFYYASPVIQVDATRVNLASITTTIQQAADNTYDASGIMNSASPTGAMTGPSSSAGFAALSAPFTPTLTWAAGANQVLLQASNAEAVHAPGTPTGVYATLAITATCLAAPAAAGGLQAVPVDDPWALLLAGLGVSALAMRRMRRRR